METAVDFPGPRGRRLSLPARVNVLVVNGQNSAQVSDLLRQRSSKRDPTEGGSEGTIGNNGNNQTHQYLSLSAIPEDIEHSNESLDKIQQQNSITVHSTGTGSTGIPEHKIINDEDEIEVADPAPDGGYGWVIVLASFLCNLIVDGIAYTFGLFFNYFVNHFGASKGKTALAGSLLSGCYLSAGPLVSALTNRYGCRAVTITGSVVSCIAFLLSAFSPNINCLLFTYGVMGGIGFGLIYLPAIVSVGYYFTSKRAFATGIAVCGSGVGAFIFAPLCQLALTYYDWRGALVIQAGLALNCAVFGALMRPLNVEAETAESEDDPDEERVGLLQIDSMKGAPELTGNTEPGVQSVYELNKIKVGIPIPALNLDAVDSEKFMDVVNQCRTEDVDTTIVQGSSLKDSAISLSLTGTTESNTGNEFTDLKGRSVSAAADPQRMTRQPAILSAGGRFAGKRTFSECNPPPLHIILSSNPGLAYRRKSTVGVITQAIPVRPISKKDIFYAGSTASIGRKSSISAQGLLRSDGQDDDETDANINYHQANLHRASVVSIPAKDVIEKVNREKEKLKTQRMTAKTGTAAKKSRSIIDFVRQLIPCCPFLPQDRKPLNKTPDVPKERKKRVCKTPSVMKEMLDFSLVTEHPAFALLSLSNVFGMMGFYIPFVYIIQHLRTQVKEKSALVLSAIGITNTLGRIVFGWLSDKVTNPEKEWRITALFINNCCLLVAGVTVTAIPFLTSFYTILLDATIFGLFISAYICLTSIIIVELVGLEKLTSGFGLVSMFRGAAAMMGPPLAGTIYDFTGSFDLTFYAAGLLLIMSAMVSFLIPSQLKPKQPPSIKLSSQP